MNAKPDLILVFVPSGCSPAQIKPEVRSNPLPTTHQIQMRSPRAAYTATLLGDGRVLNEGTVGLIGGTTRDDRVLDSAEVYEPGTGRFIESGALSVRRRKHAATKMVEAINLPNGHTLVAGGYDRQINITRHAWIYG